MSSFHSFHFETNHTRLSPLHGNRGFSVDNDLEVELRFRCIDFFQVADEAAGTEDLYDIINQSIAANVRRAVLPRYTQRLST